MKQIVQTLSSETPTEFVYGLRMEISNKEFSNSHTHNYCEFCLVISGNLRQRCNGKEFDMSAKQLCFIRSSDIHSLIAINCKSAVIYNIGIPQKITDSVSKMYGVDIIVVKRNCNIATRCIPVLHIALNNLCYA